jgi:hypothetical protein
MWLTVVSVPQHGGGFEPVASGYFFNLMYGS